MLHKLNTKVMLNTRRNFLAIYYSPFVKRLRSIVDVSFMLIYSHFNETPAKWHYALSCLIFMSYTSNIMLIACGRSLSFTQSSLFSNFYVNHIILVWQKC